MVNLAWGGQSKVFGLADWAGSRAFYDVGMDRVVRSGVAALSISPRPLARAKLKCWTTVRAVVAESAPACMDNCFAILRHSERAAGPNPPTVSYPNGTKSQPTAMYEILLVAILSSSASAAAETVPTRTAWEADWCSGWETVTSIAKGRTECARSRMSAGRDEEPGKRCSKAGDQLAEAQRWNRVSRTWLCRR